MIISQKTLIKPQHKLVDLIENNQALLLMLQHFDVDFNLGEKSISDLCKAENINEQMFISVANLYSGFKVDKKCHYSNDGVYQLIVFLKNSHSYYRFEKYPQIISYIKQLEKLHTNKELLLLEKFFNEYFDEVKEHLDYEDNVVFPYFFELIENNDNINKITPTYSSIVYSEHHTDIELKLKDFKTLILKHIKLNGSLSIRRKLLFELFELEFDLYIHSRLEDDILIPAGIEIENRNNELKL